MKTNQSGRSMIEMLGVLAIIGVLSVGGIAGYSKAMQKYRINKMIDQVTQLSQGIRTLYAGHKNYRGLSNAVIKKAHLAPDEMFESTQSYNMIHSLGGQVSVSPNGKFVGGDDKAFEIMFRYNIPQDACIDIVTHDWGSGSAGIIAISVSNSSPYVADLRYGCTESSGYVHCLQNGVVNMERAMQLCDEENSITWKFY